MNTAPTLPGFFDTPSHARPHRLVRPTSKASYAIGRERFTGRRGDVLRHLAAYLNHYNVSPTSGELAQWTRDQYPALDGTAHLLRIRRGLSDLQTVGVVESVPNGDRVCAVTESKCCCWRVRGR